MIGKYTKEQLEHGGDTLEEHERLRNIYDDLIERGKNGAILSAAEQNFVYHALIHFGENINNYPFLNDARFKDLYLTYFFDISGGSVYRKAKGTQVIEVSFIEKQSDLNYLMEEAEKWRKKIAPDMHPEKLLQEVSSETKKDIKELNKSLNLSGQPYLSGTYFYEYKVVGTYLRSRIVYLFSKEYLEETDPTDCTITLCGETIEFTEFSMVHIFNRHFAELSKQYISGKDYHQEIFNPRFLPKQIKEVVDEIDKSRLLTKQHKTEINFRFKGQVYQLWAEWQNKSVKGHQGPVRYKRLQSFYPVSDHLLLSRLKTSFNEVPLIKDLSLFIPL